MRLRLVSLAAAIGLAACNTIEGAGKDVKAAGQGIEKAGIYVAINYMGLIDEFAIFDRALTADEVKMLKEKPGLLSASVNDSVRVSPGWSVPATAPRG